MVKISYIMSPTQTIPLGHWNTYSYLSKYKNIEFSYKGMTSLSGSSESSLFPIYKSHSKTFLNTSNECLTRSQRLSLKCPWWVCLTTYKRRQLPCVFGSWVRSTSPDTGVPLLCGLFIERQKRLALSFTRVESLDYFLHTIFIKGLE